MGATLFGDGKGEFDVTIKRDTIVIPSVELEIGQWQDDKWQETSSGNVAWLKVYRFGERTQPQWDQAVNAISQDRSRLNGIVLDLRNNPGGYLQGAIDLASEFVPSGVIVTQQGRYQNESYKVSKAGKLIGVPVVILINQGTASSGEILAGALHDHLGAKLVGESSFGKGTVQDALDLRNSAGLHVTVARWLLPNGDWIEDEEGLSPDITVELPEDDNPEDDQVPTDTQLQRAIEELNSATAQNNGSNS